MKEKLLLTIEIITLISVLSLGILAFKNIEIIEEVIKVKIESNRVPLTDEEMNRVLEKNILQSKKNVLEN